MSTLLILLAIVCAIGAVVSLIRGVVIFLKTSEADLKSRETGPSASSLGQNRMMWRRIQFQALAVVAAVLLMLIAHPHTN
ncbi:MAG TPA: hypothetical protein VGC10_05930 [Sphingomonas sp.]